VAWSGIGALVVIVVLSLFPYYIGPAPSSF